MHPWNPRKASFGASKSHDGHKLMVTNSQRSRVSIGLSIHLFSRLPADFMTTTSRSAGNELVPRLDLKQMGIMDSLELETNRPVWLDGDWGGVGVRYSPLLAL
jgi:hypothetical protein